METFPRVRQAVRVLPATVLDEDALAACAQADRAAFADVYDRFFRRVYNYVRYRVGDPETTDDVTAQIFERALRHLADYDARRAPFAAWLFGIARNAVRDHLRRRQNSAPTPLEAIEDLPGDDAEPEQQIESAQARNRILRLVAALDERAQEIVALKFGAGLTNRRIADLMRLGESNVNVILYRTLRKLRQQLEEEGSNG